MENLSAHELGDATIAPSASTEYWEPSHEAIARQIDYPKLVAWVVGALLPWAGLIALLVSV